jgi:hypothetical protein
MTNEATTDPQQQKPQQGEQEPTRAVNPSDTKSNPSPQNQTPGNRPQDISKKNPSQDSDSQHNGQEKPEDEKRRAS